MALPSCLLLMVTYNRLEYTRLALEAVLALDYPDLEVVVWDNASTDGTVEYLRQRLRGLEHVRLIASPRNMGVVQPMNEVWGEGCSLGFQPEPRADTNNSGWKPKLRAEGSGWKPKLLLAKVDNDTLVPPDLLRRLAECHGASSRFGVLSRFHFRQEGEALADEHRIQEFDGVRVLAQPYVGGCAVMIRREVLERVGPIPCRAQMAQGPFMDSGWTIYQQRLLEAGLVNGYPWPPIHVDHMEDTRSACSIRSPEHQEYKRQLRRRRTGPKP